MNRKAVCLLCCVLIALAAIPALSAEEDDRIFPTFLYHLIKRHGELQTLAVVEILTTPDMPDEALYLLTFKTAEDVQIFIAALNEENIPYLTLPRNELQVGLFYTDMVKYILTDVLGF